MSEQNNTRRSRHYAVIWLTSLLLCCAGSAICSIVNAAESRASIEGFEFILRFGIGCGLVSTLPVAILGSVVSRRDGLIVVLAVSAVASLLAGWYARWFLEAMQAA
jgi:hypothetical protein